MTRTNQYGHYSLLVGRKRSWRTTVASTATAILLSLSSQSAIVHGQTEESPPPFFPPPPTTFEVRPIFGTANGYDSGGGQSVCYVSKYDDPNLIVVDDKDQDASSCCNKYHSNEFYIIKFS